MQQWWPSISLPAMVRWHRDGCGELWGMLRGSGGGLPALRRCRSSPCPGAGAGMGVGGEKLCFPASHQQWCLPGRSQGRPPFLRVMGFGWGCWTSQPSFVHPAWVEQRGQKLQSTLFLPFHGDSSAGTCVWKSLSTGARPSVAQLQHLLPMCAPPRLVLPPANVDRTLVGERHQNKRKQEEKLQRSVSHSAALQGRDLFQVPKCRLTF